MGNLSIIRCDASIEIGSGHARRCLILARELALKEFEVIFIMVQDKGDLISEISKEFRVIVLQKKESIQDNLSKDKQRGDAVNCIKELTRVGIRTVDLLIIDSYMIDIEWESKMLEYLNSHKSKKTYLLAIDDLANRKHCCDLILDQNYYGKDTGNRYSTITPGQCIQLIGSKYALLGSEYKKVRSVVVPRKSIRKILIYFGATDDGTYALRALKALQNTELKQERIIVILAKEAKQRSSLEDAAKRWSNVELLDELPTLSILLSTTDLAIGGGGSTTWERCCLGVPCITFILADNQFEMSKALSKEMQVDYLCRNTENMYEQIIIDTKNILTNKETYNYVSRQLMEYSDGKGSQRVVSAILKLIGPLDDG